MALRLAKLSGHLVTSTSNGLLPKLNTPQAPLHKIRTMASSAARKYEFLVVIPDFPGVREKRLEVRP